MSGFLADMVFFGPAGGILRPERGEDRRWRSAWMVASELAK
jgi:hypothetical protein